MTVDYKNSVNSLIWNLGVRNNYQPVNFKPSERNTRKSNLIMVNKKKGEKEKSWKRVDFWRDWSLKYRRVKKKHRRRYKKTWLIRQISLRIHCMRHTVNIEIWLNSHSIRVLTELGWKIRWLKINYRRNMKRKTEERNKLDS